MAKGYQTSDLDRDFFFWILPRLKAFRKKCGEMTMNYKTEDGMWYDVLDRMIHGIEMAIEDSQKFKDRKQCAEELALFGKYVQHLWW